MTTKEAAFLACLQGLLANPKVTNRRTITKLDESFLERVIEAADVLSERAVLRIPREEAHVVAVEKVARERRL